MKCYRRWDVNGREFFIAEDGKRVDRATAKASGIAADESAAVESWKSLGLTEEEATIAAGLPRKVHEKAAARKAADTSAQPLTEAFEALGLSAKEAQFAAE